MKANKNVLLAVLAVGLFIALATRGTGDKPAAKDGVFSAAIGQTAAAVKNAYYRYNLGSDAKRCRPTALHVHRDGRPAVRAVRVSDGKR